MHIHKLKAFICFLIINIFFLHEKALYAQQLKADFTASNISGCTPLVVNFSDLSSGNPTAWKWDLGNGNISYVKNPSVVYYSSGTYKISLVVSNSRGKDTIIKDKFIRVSSSPSVKFNGELTGICVPATVNFSDGSSALNNDIVSWKWDFGDGKISTEQNPKHVYTESGDYSVTLQVKNKDGCSGTLLQQRYINIPEAVKADFTNEIQKSCKAPVEIKFKNNSAGVNGLAYNWDFGDGGITESENPSHLFVNAGEYNIKLRATDVNGCISEASQKIIVGNITSGFLLDSAVCPGTDITFSNTTSQLPLRMLWYFGDNTTSEEFEPVKKYTAPGDYTVSLVSNYGSCIDSVSKSVRILPQPEFDADAFTGCSIPFTVNFTSNLSGQKNIVWNFGDGGSSTLPNPSHTYSTLGEFDVTLTSSCKSIVKKEKYIKAKSPSAGILGLPVEECLPYTHYFYPLVFNSDSVVSYSWDFGDGTKSTEKKPAHTYTIAGNYTVTLTMTTIGGCVITRTEKNGISVGTKPTAKFSSSPSVSCAKTPVSFTDLSTGDVTDRIWVFELGDTSHMPNAAHSFKDTGFVEVTLIAKNYGCADYLTCNNCVYILPPVAKVTVKGYCDDPMRKDFKSTSAGANVWNWDFGDGQKSTLENPVHKYEKTGSYKVTLVTANTTSGCDHKATRDINVIDLKPSFTTIDTNICKNAKARFKVLNTTLAEVLTYDWSFGDGTKLTTGIGSSPSNYLFEHQYKKSGVFTVTLIVTDLLGCADTIIQTKCVTVHAPTAAFIVKDQNICVNEGVGFYSLAVPAPSYPLVKWEWFYGDGKSESYRDTFAVHKYTQGGLFDIALKVTDIMGCTDSLNKPKYVNISKATADFISIDTISCPLKAIEFNSRSTGNKLKYYWSFGDGDTSGSVNPKHTYTIPGWYTVSLKVIDQYGCTDSIVKSQYIHIVYPEAKFTMSDSVSSCPPMFVKFTNNSVNFKSVSWDFGDGNKSSVLNPEHSYYKAGIYWVKLTAISPGGCTHQVSKRIIIKGPQGDFSVNALSGCDSLQTTFSATTINNNSFIWDFGDGTTLTTYDSIVKHSYKHTGKYVPTMILVDTTGCKIPITSNDTIKVIGINPAFGTTATVICDAGSVNFRDSTVSNDIITKYSWDFGDGNKSTQRNPANSFTVSGNYPVKLKVTSKGGCSDSIIINIPVKVIKSPKIAIQSVTDNACSPAKYNLEGELVSGDAAATWKWIVEGKSFDGQKVNNQVLTEPGAHIVQLTMTDINGCKKTVNKTLTVYPLPALSAGMDTAVCEGTSASLLATGAVKYNWTSPENISCAGCADPVAWPQETADYIVKGTNAYGCIATDTINVYVQKPLKLNINKPKPLCKGSVLNLKASGCEQYQWTPSEGLDNAASANPLAYPVKTTRYHVVGTDNYNCFTDTAAAVVEVYPIPEVNAGIDKTINIGDPVDLVPQISSDVTEVLWSPTDGTFRNNYPGITVKPKRTTEYTVEVSNNGGCTAKDAVTVIVVCNGNNIFVPNTFSPNGDGVNDIFYPRGKGLQTIKSLRVFGRWGEMVYSRSNFTANNPSYGWDGTYKGQKAMSDNFIYIMELVCDNGETMNYQGTIALVR